MHKKLVQMESAACRDAVTTMDEALPDPLSHLLWSARILNPISKSGLFFPYQPPLFV